MNATTKPRSIWLDMPFVLTTFFDEKAKSAHRESMTIDELIQRLTATDGATKKALPLLKLATFGDKRSHKGSLRHNANVLAISGIEGDYDGESLSVDQAASLLEAAGILAIVYTTPSHTEAAPRLRVLCLLSALAPPEHRTALLDRLNGVLGGVLAHESWTLSQAYYFGRVNNNPSHVVRFIDGTPIDLLPGLDAGAIGKPGSTPKEGTIGFMQRIDRAAASNTRLDAWRESILDNVRNAPDGEKHIRLRSAALILGGVAAAAGWTDADLLGRLLAALPASVVDRAAAKEAAVWGLSEGRKKPLHLEDRPNPNAPPRASLDPDPADLPPNKLTGYDKTEDGIALAFAAEHRNELLYDHTRGAWFKWTGSAWKPDDTKLAFSYARQVCREQARGSIPGTLRGLAKAATAAGVERFAAADQVFKATSKDWNSDTFLLGTPGGTVDLKTGKLRAADPADRITKLTAVTPADRSDCPQWLAFLEQVTAGDPGLIRFIKQWCGYCLTGDTREHALVFVYGPGGNGKSVFLETLAFIMGDYATGAALDAFTSTTGDRHSTDMAMLDGARLVTVTETEDGRSWAETKLKSMTGGDRVIARFMHQNFFEYIPQFKLTISGNHKPILKNIDAAARRRFNFIPFNYTPPVKDMQLQEKLRTEAAGILRWMIEGCLDWQAHGLTRPNVVLDATAEYFADQDTLGQWIQDECSVGPDQSETVADLLQSFSDYAMAAGEKTRPGNWFSAALKNKGFESLKSTPGNRGQRGFKGISVNPVLPADLKRFLSNA